MLSANDACFKKPTVRQELIGTWKAQHAVICGKPQERNPYRLKLSRGARKRCRQSSFGTAQEARYPAREEILLCRLPFLVYVNSCVNDSLDPTSRIGKQLLFWSISLLCWHLEYDRALAWWCHGRTMGPE